MALGLSPQRRKSRRGARFEIAEGAPDASGNFGADGHSQRAGERSDRRERAQQTLPAPGINVAQRVMDCGDAGHILLSQHVAEDLAEYERWRPFLHDIGTFEVKHGARVSVTNLYSDEVGNPNLPSKLQAVKKHHAHVRWAAVAIGAAGGGRPRLLLASLFCGKGPAAFARRCGGKVDRGACRSTI